MDGRMVPETFRNAFRDLTMVLQPRGVQPDACERYWDAVMEYPPDAWQRAFEQLKTSRFWPGAEDLRSVAARLSAVRPTVVVVVEGSRTLDDLDGLGPNDPERDEICKRLSRVDQVALMARYGRRMCA